MERYNVVLWFPDGSYHYERRDLDAEAAVTLAHQCTQRPAAKIGVIDKVMIEDGGGCTAFLWEKGKVVFPTREQCGVA